MESQFFIETKQDKDKRKWSKNSYYKFGRQPISKKKIKKMLKFDYEKIITKKANGYSLIHSNKKLLSVSSILKVVNDYNLFSIPENILEHRRNLGMYFMLNAKKIVDEKLASIDDLIGISELEKKHLTTFFKWILENQYTILYCEKMFCNGELIAFFDFVIRNKEGHIFIVEVKLRNSLEEKETDLFQIRTYCEMLGIPGKLLIIGDNGEIKEIHITSVMFKDHLRVTQKFLKKFGIELSFKNKLQID